MKATKASLKNYNTYHVECIAEYLFQPNNEEELLEILRIIKEKKLNEKNYSAHCNIN